MIKDQNSCEFFLFVNNDDEICSHCGNKRTLNPKPEGQDVFGRLEVTRGCLLAKHTDYQLREHRTTKNGKASGKRTIEHYKAYK